MLEAPKRARGRPPKPEGVTVKFSIPKAQADYLLAVGSRFGWGDEINDIIRAIIVSEVMALQKSDFHHKQMPGEAG